MISASALLKPWKSRSRQKPIANSCATSHDQAFTQQELCTLLGIHQPDVSNLLNGRVSRFSVSKLIRFAGKLNLSAEIKLLKPRTAKPLAGFSAESKKRVAVVA